MNVKGLLGPVAAPHQYRVCDTIPSATEAVSGRRGKREKSGDDCFSPGGGKTIMENFKRPLRVVRREPVAGKTPTTEEQPVEITASCGYQAVTELFKGDGFPDRAIPCPRI